MKSIVQVALLAAMVLASGCCTSYRTQDERFMAHRANYRRVQILPVWMDGAGNVDATLTTNQLQSLYRQAGSNLCTAVRQSLADRGYEPVGTNFGSIDDARWLNPDAKRQLQAVRVDFCEGLLRPYDRNVSDHEPLMFHTNAPPGYWWYVVKHNAFPPTTNPFCYRMSPAFTNMLSKLAVTNVPAVLLVDSKIYFESDHNHTKRVAWNCTGGGVLVLT